MAEPDRDPAWLLPGIDLDAVAIWEVNQLRKDFHPARCPATLPFKQQMLNKIGTFTDESALLCYLGFSLYEVSYFTIRSDKTEFQKGCEKISY